MDNYELTSLVKEYITTVELINRKKASLDLLHLEDTLNRELSIDLFLVNMEEKVDFILNQPRIMEILVTKKGE